MTIEKAVFVELRPDDGPVSGLIRDIRAADARARKSLPGERTDILRVETLSSQLERVAATVLGSDHRRGIEAPVVPRFAGLSFVDRQNLYERSAEHRQLLTPWIESGSIAVELRLPLEAGQTARSASLGSRTRPEAVWHADPGTPPKRAAAERFKQQIDATLTPHDPPSYIEPSGVSNTILTNTLRRFVKKTGDRVDAPVRYQDGSVAEPFPLRCLPLADTVPAFARELRFAMLSIRHTEMDIEVDGCWLRNYDISRPRPAAETDLLAFEMSKTQLSALADSGPVLIKLYQTGLDPVVVGFYRALVHHLLAVQRNERRHPVAVLPMYFRHAPPTDEQDVSRPLEHSYFAKGKPWTL